MEDMKNGKRSSFSGKLGYVLAAAGASVGLGNIWRFPYLAAKYGGGIFLIIYIVLALTFGYTMIVAETAIGRMTRKSPVGAFKSFGKKKWLSFGGWINAVIPVLIVPYYSVIGGWVIKYLVEYFRGNAKLLAEDGYFTDFISNGVSTELCFVAFCAFTLIIIFAGVQNGIERVSKIMMPILIVLSVIIAVYSVTRPGALAGVKYFLVPNVKNFSWMTVVAAMGQMFYSLSIAMGILITFWLLHEERYGDRGFDQKCRDIRYRYSDHGGTYDNPGGICILWRRSEYTSGRTITDVYHYSKGIPEHGIWNCHRNRVLPARTICCCHKLHSTLLRVQCRHLRMSLMGRKKATVLVGVIMLALGSLSSLGYGPLAGIKIIGMQFLDLFDFLTNSVMMPIAAFLTSLFVSRVVGIDKIEEEIIHGESAFRRKKVFVVMIKYLCPVFAIIILLSSVANALGWIKM